MELITKSMVEAAFARLCKVMGHKVAESYQDVGAWRVDYVGCYGGYVVERIDNSSGGVSHPFGIIRRNAREMYQAMHFAIDAVEYKERAGTLV